MMTRIARRCRRLETHCRAVSADDVAEVRLDEAKRQSGGHVV